MPRPRPRPGRHPRLVLRRLARGAGRAAPPGCLPRRGGRSAGHRPAAVQRPLARAVPRPPRRVPRALPRPFAGARAPRLTRPLLLIHGLADDKVHPAHTLRLSAALLAAGRPHRCCCCPAPVTPTTAREPPTPCSGWNSTSCAGHWAYGEPTSLWLTGPTRGVFERVEDNLLRRITDLGWLPCWRSTQRTHAEIQWDTAASPSPTDPPSVPPHGCPAACYDARPGPHHRPAGRHRP